MENNWKQSTIEKLENDYWKENFNVSHLISTCQDLRKKPLYEFEIEDCRVMIGQDIGLVYLIPIAIEFLEKNILAEGDFFEGDLLLYVLKSDKNYWLNNVNDWNKVLYLFKKNKERLISFETTKEIRTNLFEAFNEFEKLK